MEAIREAIVESKTIRFEGNNYSEEWRLEAEKRGLLNLQKTPEALAWMLRPESKEFFNRMGVLKPEETEAQCHVRLERYLKDVEIEIEALKDLVRTAVLPAAYKQQSMLAESIKAYAEAAKVAGSSAGAVVSQAEDQLRLEAGKIIGIETLKNESRLQVREQLLKRGLTVLEDDDRIAIAHIRRSERKRSNNDRLGLD